MGENLKLQERDLPPMRGSQVSNRWNCSETDGLGVGGSRRSGEATGVKGVPPTKVLPFWRGTWEEGGLPGRWTPGGYVLSPTRHPDPHPRGSLTFDFSCPRLGGTKPARSSERRQDARSSRAMVGWGRVSGSPKMLSDPGPPSV